MRDYEVLMILREVNNSFKEFNKERPDLNETGAYICEGISKAIEDLEKYYNVD